MNPLNEREIGRDVARNFRLVDADVRAVATRTTALETATADSGWVAMTLNSPWVDYGAGFRTARRRKLGSLVIIEGLVKSGTTGSTISTLPVGWRPPEGLVLGTITDPNVFARLDVTAAGAIVCYFTGTSAYVSIHCSFHTV